MKALHLLAIRRWHWCQHAVYTNILPVLLLRSKRGVCRVVAEEPGATEVSAFDQRTTGPQDEYGYVPYSWACAVCSMHAA